MEIPERYYACEPPSPPILLRRTVDASGLRDEKWRDGRWEPTGLIVDWMFGHADDVSEVREEWARSFAPAAF